LPARKNELLSVKKICAAYEGLQVLWDVTLRVSEKEKVSIVGPNGAGKSTLLKTIAGLLPPTDGEIWFKGNKINFFPPHERNRLGLSLVPEGRRLFPRMSVLENLEVGVSTQEAKDKIKDTFELIFQLFPVLKERKNQLAGTLSGGEQQMLAIGRALMSRPKLLMLDEPSLGLAPIMVDKLYAAIENLAHEGISILLVEQHVERALFLSDRAYLLERGSIVREGRGRDLLKDRHVRKAYLGM
jgi:branched-chain amino acid transport system ATP-binding protein